MTQQTAPATAEANGSGPAEKVSTLPPPLGEPGSGHLAQKIARIAGAVGRLIEDGEVKGNRGFTYATVDAMAAGVVPHLAAEGVAMYPVELKVLRDETVEREKSGDSGAYTQIRWITEVLITWELTDGETSIKVPALGFSSDTDGSEKNANQAHTFSRINAYKAVFHLIAGEDPEKKGRGGTGATGTGELPTVTGEVTGTVALGTDGRIGVKFRAEAEADFEAVKQAVKDLGGRWEKEPKVWLLAGDKAGMAVALGRHLGLVIVEPLASQFPAPAPTAAPPADAAAPSGWSSPEDRPPPTPSSDDDIPF